MGITNDSLRNSSTDTTPTTTANSGNDPTPTTLCNLMDFDRIECPVETPKRAPVAAAPTLTGPAQDEVTIYLGGNKSIITIPQKVGSCMLFVKGGVSKYRNPMMPEKTYGPSDAVSCEKATLDNAPKASAEYAQAKAFFAK